MFCLVQKNFLTCLAQNWTMVYLFHITDLPQISSNFPRSIFGQKWTNLNPVHVADLGNSFRPNSILFRGILVFSYLLVNKPRWFSKLSLILLTTLRPPNSFILTNFLIYKIFSIKYSQGFLIQARLHWRPSQIPLNSPNFLKILH